MRIKVRRRRDRQTVQRICMTAFIGLSAIAAIAVVAPELRAGQSTQIWTSKPATSTSIQRAAVHTPLKATALHKVVWPSTAEGIAVAPQEDLLEALTHNEPAPTKTKHFHGNPVKLPISPDKSLGLPKAARELASQPVGNPTDPVPTSTVKEKTSTAVIDPTPGKPAIQQSAAPLANQTSLLQTWQQEALAFSATSDRPLIAIVIDDLGLRRSNTQKIIDLPSPMTLSFLPYAGDLQNQANRAKAAGHEIMLHLPMEPLGRHDPGPNALLANLDSAEFQRRLELNLDTFTGYASVNNHMGSKVTANATAMSRVMAELRSRGLMFMDSVTNPKSVAHSTAYKNGLPALKRDIFLDHHINRTFIRQQLAKTERLAKAQGYAIAIAHPHQQTIDVLREWTSTLTARGFQLAPVTAIYRLSLERTNLVSGPSQ